MRRVLFQRLATRLGLGSDMPRRNGSVIVGRAGLPFLRLVSRLLLRAGQALDPSGSDADLLSALERLAAPEETALENEPASLPCAVCVLFVEAAASAAADSDLVYRTWLLRFVGGRPRFTTKLGPTCAFHAQTMTILGGPHDAAC